MLLRPPTSTLFPYTTLFRSSSASQATISCCDNSPPSTQKARCTRSSAWRSGARSEEHTSELQSRVDIVCRLLLEKKNEKGEHMRSVVIVVEQVGAREHRDAG